MADPHYQYVDETFSLVNYSWILDAASKSDVLQLDSRTRMTAEFDKKLMANVFANPFGQNQLHPDHFALKFEVRRDHLVEDALNALTGPSAENMNFNMPIRVVFAGESG
jgi:hypothetical protein